MHKDDVIRDALVLLRQDSITDAVSAKSNRIYDEAKRTFLVMRDWSFARVVAEVTIDQSTYTGLIARPQNMINIVDVRSADKRLGWSIFGDKIKLHDTPAETVDVIGTADVDAEKFSPVAYSAFVAYLARELAIPVTGRQKDLEAAAALYAEKLKAAALADYREGNPGKSLIRQVIAFASSELGVDENQLSESADAMYRRLDDVYESTVDEVLAVHPWRFVKRKIRLASAFNVARARTNNEERYVYMRPGNCVQILTLENVLGDIIDWTVDGNMITSSEPATSITYIVRNSNVDTWPPHVKRVLMFRLACDISIVMPNRAKNASDLMSLYQEQLRKAQQHDAAESNPGRNAWSTGRFSSVIKGGVRNRMKRGFRHD